MAVCLVLLVIALVRYSPATPSKLLNAAEYSSAVDAARKEISNIQSLHNHRMAEAAEQLSLLRDRDRREARKSNMLLSTDQQALASEIVRSAEENRKVSVPI